MYHLSWSFDLSFYVDERLSELMGRRRGTLEGITHRGYQTYLAMSPL
ncbi:hypothetical protein WCP94_003753 [Bilophila wadsworthia]